MFEGGEGKAIFVMDETGRFFASKRQARGEFHHSSFLAGEPVAAAGEITVDQGVVKAVTLKSGHYKPREFFMDQFSTELGRRGVDTSGIIRGSGF